MPLSTSNRSQVAPVTGPLTKLAPTETVGSDPPKALTELPSKTSQPLTTPANNASATTLEHFIYSIPLELFK